LPGSHLIIAPGGDKEVLENPHLFSRLRFRVQLALCGAFRRPQDMDPEPTAPPSENGEHKPAEIQANGERHGANRWSTALRSWVDEFQLNGRGQSLPAFDSLLKDPLS
jgi:hypothetical protein